MNRIILRTGRTLQIAGFALAVFLTAVGVLASLSSGGCEDYRRPIICEAMQAASPVSYFIPALIIFALGWRHMLRTPNVILTRDGIEARLHPMGAIPWAHIQDVEIKRVQFAKRLVIRRKAHAIPPWRWSPRMMFSAMFILNARTHVYISQFHIDCPLHHLKHWVDEGIKNAAADVSPDPFFTVPY